MVADALSWIGEKQLPQEETDEILKATPLQTRTDCCQGVQ